MKKISLILLFSILCSSGLFAQSAIVVNGIWEGPKPENAKLFKIVNSNLHELASAKIGAEGQFLLASSLEKEGYYTIGMSATSPRYRYTFYLKPGDQLNVKIANGTYELFGENTPENIEMAKWHDFIQPLENKVNNYTEKGSTYVDFFPLLEEKEGELKTYSEANTANVIFNESFVDYKKFDFMDQAISFLFTPRRAHPQGEDFPDFYRNIDIEGLTKNSAILNYPGGLHLLMNCCMTSVNQSGSMTQEEKSKAFGNPAAIILGKPLSDRIIEPTIKGELAIMLVRNNKTLAGFEEFEGKYKDLLVNDDQKKRWEGVRTSLEKNATKTPAIDFKFPDRNGKEISLSDFKGKVVYVDVWATWCGPCKKEFPLLKKLEEEYHANKDMVFIGVSVDVDKDKQKWLNFLDKEQLPGIQLFGGDPSKESLGKPYNIKGIPRFILVGKDGNLILADAPKPSSPEIKAILDDALKK
ncbi:MAG: TlpA disulfide reductase family protein [Dysgonomonas sp.]|nr:TlpA disulfide reductase family protein [Dysgonomonas sp.]